MAALKLFIQHLSALCKASWEAPVTQRGKCTPPLDEEGLAYQHLLWRPVRWQRYEWAEKAKREESPSGKSLPREGDIRAILKVSHTRWYGEMVDWKSNRKTDLFREFHGPLELKSLTSRYENSEEVRSQTMVGSACQATEIYFSPRDNREPKENFLKGKRR